MKINTGRGTIPLITLVGIWSVSALTSLPGLVSITYFGTTYYHFSTCHGTGYTDAYLPAFAADNSFCAVGGQAGRNVTLCVC